MMLTVQLFGTGRQWRPPDDALAVLWQADHRLHPLPWTLPVPLRVHGQYSLFSPSTRYRDQALGPSLFH